MSGFCVYCGHRVESFEGLSACPACGSKGLPCDDANQVSVSVNWHELRVLVIWAERWGLKIGKAGTVYAIARRIREQFPDRTPLSLAGDISGLREAFGAENIQHNIKGIEGATDLPIPDISV